VVMLHDVDVVVWCIILVPGFLFVIALDALIDACGMPFGAMVYYLPPIVL